MKATGGSSFDFITCACPLPENVSSPSAINTVTYDDPKVLGHPLDYCLHKKSNCGQEAADAYCKSYGSTGSVNFTKVSYRPISKGLTHQVLHFKILIVWTLLILW